MFFSRNLFFAPEKETFFLSQFVFFSLIIAGKLTVFYNQVFNFRPWENLLRHKECLVLGWLWGEGGGTFMIFVYTRKPLPPSPFQVPRYMASSLHWKWVCGQSPLPGRKVCAAGRLCRRLGQRGRCSHGQVLL